MSTIEERTAAREAELSLQLSDQRRLARPEDYVYDKSQEAYWDTQDISMHTDKAVDASIPQEFWRVEVEEEASEPGAKGRPKKRKERLIPPSRDIMRVELNQFVEASTWWPGRDRIIKDWFINGDGFFPAEGRRIYNQYRPAPVSLGNPEEATPWVEHIKKLWPNKKEHEFFFDYCAHMVQRPEEKCNAAIVLSGTQGIGKDAALWPIKAAIGSWNAKGIDPDQLFSDYKPWLQTLMLVVDEVRPSKDEFHASSMYNILKPMIVAPPDTLPLNDKHKKLRYIVNVLRVFITTNDWMAMYIPPEDRRMFIMHSSLESKWHETEGDPDYFFRLFGWMETGGAAHIAAWLAARDLTEFRPKAQVTKTLGWQSVANTWAAPEDGVTFALEALGHPDVFFGAELLSGQFDNRDEVAGMLKSPRKLGHRLQRSGYLCVAPPDGQDRWSFRANGGIYRSRLAFVKQSLMVDSFDFGTILQERGNILAAQSISKPLLKKVDNSGF
jgi:hypothetical protein